MRRNLLLLFLIFVLFAVQSFIYLEKNLWPPLVNLAKVRLKQIATQSINTAISDRLSLGTNYEQLIDWRTDKNGKITGFMLNYSEHMRITSDTIKTVEGQLLNLQSIPEHIPLGQAMHSSILASFGPNIPVRLVPAGNVKVDLNTRYQNAGINMILVEVYIHIVAEVSVIIPFDSEPEVVETEVPVSYALVVGDVPTYYFDGKGNPAGSNTPPPSLALPPGINSMMNKDGSAAAGTGAGAAAGSAKSGAESAAK
ncbi:sporulation protein YunB [Paenibacillus konkukensis]|nr:sporulation protein YunB [Paenibacillus konkukensis]